MEIGNDWIEKKINTRKSILTYLVSKYTYMYVYSTHDTKVNVLEEIGCMGGVVGSGHAY